jgi:hypothetical protein
MRLNFQVVSSVKRWALLLNRFSSFVLLFAVLQLPRWTRSTIPITLARAAESSRE